MTEEHKVKIIVDDDASRAYDKAAKSADNYDESATKVEGSNKSLKVSFAAVAASIGVAVEVGRRAVQTYGNIQAAEGRLERAVRKAGGAQDDVNRLRKVARENLDMYGGTIEEHLDALDVMTRQTGSVAQAEADVALAHDIAATESMELTQAVEILRKARNGEVEELKNLNGINKDHAQELNRIENATVRAETAIRALSDEYANARNELWGVNEQLASAEGNFNRLQGAAGKVAVEVGEAFGVFEEQAGEKTFLGKMADEAELLARTIERMDVSAIEILALNPVFGPAGAANLAAQFAAVQARGEPVAPGGGTGRDLPTAPDLAFDTPEGQEKLREASRRRAERDRRRAQRRQRDAARRRAQRQREAEDMGAEAGEDVASRMMGIADDAVAQDERRERELESINENLAKKREELSLIEEERSIREQLAQLRLEDRDMLADMVEIRMSDLTASEKQLAIQSRIEKEIQASKDEQRAMVDARMQELSALSGQVGHFLDMAGEQEAARAVNAASAIGELIYQGLAAEGSLNFFSAGKFFAAAAVAAQVASGGFSGGGGGGGSMGGGGGRAQPAQPERQGNIRENAKVFAEEFAEAQNRTLGDTIVNVNFRKVGAVMPDEGRVLANGVAREMEGRL